MFDENLGNEDVVENDADTAAESAGRGIAQYGSDRSRTLRKSDEIRTRFCSPLCTILGRNIGLTRFFDFLYSR